MGLFGGLFNGEHYREYTWGELYDIIASNCIPDEPVVVFVENFPELSMSPDTSTNLVYPPRRTVQLNCHHSAPLSQITAGELLDYIDVMIQEYGDYDCAAWCWNILPQGTSYMCSKCLIEPTARNEFSFSGKIKLNEGANVHNAG